MLGASPGGYSDDISRAIKRVNPAAAATSTHRARRLAAPPARAHQPRPPIPPRQRVPKVRAEKPPRAPKPPREKKPPRVPTPKPQRPVPAPVDPAHPAAAWPPNLQAAAQLRADLAALGLTLPFPRGAGRHVPLGRADVRDALARAYRAGLHLRAQAILVLGSAPGGASDEIGKLLDQHDRRSGPGQKSAPHEQAAEAGWAGARPAYPAPPHAPRSDL